MRDPSRFDETRLSRKISLRGRGIYLLPNLLTTAALFSGFYAMVQAMNQRFDHAAAAIFVAMVWDTLDGRVARLTKTQSAFGAEYDSLSDMLSFGAAPALVLYEWSLKGMHKLGWVAAFVYVAGAALRLARFNTQAVADKRFFQGLPSPAAAALLAGFVWVAEDYEWNPMKLQWFSWAIAVFAGLTMVSNLRYYSFKTINLKRSVPFTVLLVLSLGLIVFLYQPPLTVLALFLVYAISGYLYTGWQMLRNRVRN